MECGQQQEFLAAQAGTEEVGQGRWLNVGGKKLFAKQHCHSNKKAHSAFIWKQTIIYEDSRKSI